jgi:hypothetical protein
MTVMPPPRGADSDHDRENGGGTEKPHEQSDGNKITHRPVPSLSPPVA